MEERITFLDFSFANSAPAPLGWFDMILWDFFCTSSLLLMQNPLYNILSIASEPVRRSHDEREREGGALAPRLSMKFLFQYSGSFC